MSTIKQEIRSLNDAIANLNLNSIENFLQKHESNLKVFSEIKTRKFQERQKALIHNINVFIDDLITESFDENENKSIIPRVATFINTPGLQHLAENTFLNLNYREIKACELLNGSFQLFVNQLMENPLFFLKKFVLGGMSKKNETDWTEIIQITRGTKVEVLLLLYLKRYFKSEKVFDCDVPSIIKKVTYGSLSTVSLDYYRDEIVKILDPTNYPSIQHRFNDIPRTPISWAALYWHSKIVQILIPLTDNPNAPDEDGKTLMYKAAWYGDTEIVKILAPLTDNPNAPDEIGRTPIYQAAWNGHTDIIKILAPLTDNPNAPKENGQSPIEVAKIFQHIETVKFLESLSISKKQSHESPKTKL